ncbi:MAG: SPFH/Band 7/PHB domain protein [Bacilli bacterium]|nr:SPFH/Band 7/PHB domain protein [Bacilli bacterium]
MGPLEIILIILGVILLIGLISNIKIVPQAHEYVVEFFGKYKRTLKAGIHLTVPLAEKVSKRITMMEQIMDAPPQPVITKDNVTMQIDSVVYYRVYDSKLYAYGAVNPEIALANLTATTLRNIVGELDLDGTLTSRDLINAKMTEIIDKATDEWGIKVTRVELKNIIPPKEIRDAMEKQMKAERDRRETLLQAEGHKSAIITRAEGDKQAAILQAEGERDARIARAEGEAREIYLKKKAEADGLQELIKAGITPEVLELKRFEALEKVADGQASKIIVPTDAVEMVKKDVIFAESAGVGDVTKQGKKKAEPKSADPCCDK